MRFVLGGTYAALQREDGVIGGVGGMVFILLLLVFVLLILVNLKDINDDIH